MTSSAEFIRSLGIAASVFPDFPGMAFNYAGEPVRLGMVKEIGLTCVSLNLSGEDLEKAQLSPVLGLICFLADVRSIDLVLDFGVPPDTKLVSRVRDMLLLNGFSPCIQTSDKSVHTWARLAQSIAA